MWNSISQLLAFLFTYSDKFARHDKQIEELERKAAESARQINQLTMALERQAEREQWREQAFRQALELERLKLENQALRQRAALPPAKPANNPDES